MLETLVDFNDCNNAPFSNENLRQEVCKFMAKTEEEEHDSKRKASNVTMDTFCHQYLVTTNSQL